MSDDGGRLSRRAALIGAGGLAVAAGAGAAGWQFLSGGERPPTESLDDATSATLAARFAPDLQFGAAERWYPVDPSRYASESDGERVVSGFDAFDAYSAERAAGTVTPTVFYRVVRYADTDLAVVQYWLYSAFDQFSVNFHWHDWELLQVFLDTSGGSAGDGSTDADGSTGDGDESTGTIDPAAAEPVLFDASAHSRKVPNNEYLDPTTDRASVISEVGSHSSGLGINETREVFERLGLDGEPGDVTNPILPPGDVPFAYGLPRDEGVRLPYLLPELDGNPIHEHPRLPNVDRDDLVPAEITVGSFAGLPEPPENLPTRTHALTLQFAELAADAASDRANVSETTDEAGTDDAGAGGTANGAGTSDESSGSVGLPADEEGTGGYQLAAIETIQSIEAFTGPQLSFPFAVPEFGEDLVSKHISTPGVPWNQPRFEDPISDVTDPSHQTRLADQFDLPKPGGASALVARLRETAASDDVPGANGVTTEDATTAGVALIESDPVAVPTVGTTLVVFDPEPGEHRVTVNAPGVAPHSERLQHDPDEPDATVTTDAGGGDAGGTDGANGTTDTEGPKETTDASGESETTDASGGSETTDDESDTATPASGGDSAESVAVTRAGASGRVVVTPNAQAVKLQVDGGDRLDRLQVTDDFGGQLYDSRSGSDGRQAVYVHRDGAYTADVRDADGQPGAYRVNPGREQAAATIESVTTGKRSMASYLETFLRETVAQVRAFAEGRDIDSVVPADARNPAAGRAPVQGSETPTGTTVEGDTDEDEGTETPGTVTAGTTTGGQPGEGNPPGGNGTPGGGTPAEGTADGTPTDGTPGPEGGPPTGLDILIRRLEAALGAAVNALRAAGNRGGSEGDSTETAGGGSAEQANQQLRGLRNRIEAVSRTVEAGPGELPDGLVALVRRRLELLDRQIQRAITADAV